MEIINKDYISLKEASKIAGCTPEHLNLMTRRERLKGKKLGRNWYTTKEWLESYLIDLEKRKSKAREERKQNGFVLELGGRIEKEKAFLLSEEKPTVQVIAKDGEEKRASEFFRNQEESAGGLLSEKLVVEAKSEKGAERIAKVKSRKLFLALSWAAIGAFVFLTSSFFKDNYLKKSKDAELEKLFGEVNEISFFDEKEGLVKGEEAESENSLLENKFAHASENYKIKQIRFGGDVIVMEDEDVNLEIRDIRSESFLSKKQDEAKMIITWTTNKPALSELEYAKSNGRESKKIKESGFGYHHGVVIPKLELDQVYVFKVKVKDKWGNEVTSGDYAVYAGKRAVSVVELITRELEKMFGWAKR